MSEDYLIWGRRPVAEALESGRQFNKVVVARGATDAKIVAAARERRVPVVETDREALDRMVGGGVHQGVVAFVSPIEYVELDDVADLARERGEDLFVALLDGIMDPHNLGAIVRTANAAGAHGVVIPARRSAQVSPAAARASAGAVEHTRIARVPNLAQAITDLKKRGVWVVGTSPDSSQHYFEADLSGPIAVVVGNEGKGMSRLVAESCDFTVSIPMVGEIASLNAGVAWAVIAYEVVRQRMLAAERD